MSLVEGKRLLLRLRIKQRHRPVILRRSHRIFTQRRKTHLIDTTLCILVLQLPNLSHVCTSRGCFASLSYEICHWVQLYGTTGSTTGKQIVGGREGDRSGSVGEVGSGRSEHS